MGGTENVDGVELAEDRLLEMSDVRIAGHIQLVEPCAILRAGTIATGTTLGAGISNGAGRIWTAILHGQRVARLHGSDSAEAPARKRHLRPSWPIAAIEWTPDPAINKALAMGLVRLAAVIDIGILKAAGRRHRVPLLPSVLTHG